MSDLLKIAHQIAVARREHRASHHRLFPIGAGRGLPGRSAAQLTESDRAALQNLTQGLEDALGRLGSLGELHLSIRRGVEIRASLHAYTEALLSAVTLMQALGEACQASPRHDEGAHQTRMRELKIAYDDALQRLGHIGPRLNEMLERF